MENTNDAAPTASADVIPDSIGAASTDAVSERKIVASAAAGDGAAFEVLMRRYNQRLYRTARSIVKNDADAEDVVQDAYLRAWRALGTWRAESRLSTWLVRIVTNEALGRLRREKAKSIPLDTAMISSEANMREALMDSSQPDPEQSLLREQSRETLEARIDALPESFRTVFMLRAIEEMSVEEVAGVLDIPQATVRSRFFRARSLLRRSLATEMDSEFRVAFAFDGARCDRIVNGVLARARVEGLCTTRHG
ncbi:MAG: hypothetical protein MNPFHGCM_02811 [Gemmatimonadaceae bacterium]|nr:hypothetical protein [Gemmatimonadaceae bacterium]